MSSLSNYPPGITDSMIPGNRPEDEEYERLQNEFLETVMADCKCDFKKALERWKQYRQADSEVREENLRMKTALSIIRDMIRDCEMFGDLEK